MDMVKRLSSGRTLAHVETQKKHTSACRSRTRTCDWCTTALKQSKAIEPIIDQTHSLQCLSASRNGSKRINIFPASITRWLLDGTPSGGGLSTTRTVVLVVTLPEPLLARLRQRTPHRLHLGRVVVQEHEGLPRWGVAQELLDTWLLDTADQF